MADSLRTELYNLVRSVPAGSVTTYGRLGRALPSRVPAIMIGKWMAQAPPDVPWWRVIGANGDLPLSKRDPALAEAQAKRLKEEGIPIVNQVVDLTCSLFEFI